ncbi:EI24 domain-containing protein, partial [Klebsiella pneumoniae]|nr:EI24 domain-containing protein [Klebsiella pneumoniae]
VIEGIKIALLSLVVYLFALPFLLFGGFGALIFFFATAYLLGREYFELAAMRFHPVAEAKALRRRNRGTVFAAGCFIAGFVSIPI